MILVFYLFLSSFLFYNHGSSAFERADPDDSHYIELATYTTPPSSPEPESKQFDVPVTRASEGPSEYFKNFWDWQTACANNKERSPITKELFVREMNAFTTHFKNGNIINESYWVQPADCDAVMPSMKFLLQHSFEPYVVKLEAEPDENTKFMGDIHGDIDTFNQFIQALALEGITDPQDPFKVINPKAQIIFLGDYSDRGAWGLEVLYALSRFIRVNSPQGAIQRVIGLRGNHEDPRVNFTNPGNNLYHELKNKFDDINIITLIEKFYNCMPLALFFKSGTNALLACHGGIEPGFRDTHTLLNSSGKLRYILMNGLYRKEMLERLPQDDFKNCFQQLKEHREFKDFDPCASGQEVHLINFGFLWNDYDFIPNSSKTSPIEYIKGRGMKFPEQVTKAWFALNSSPTCQLIGNIRGHQHSSETMARILNQDGKSDPEEAGLAKIWFPDGQKQSPEKLWPGIVCTLCVCPNATYGEHYGFNFGTYCTLTTGKTLEEWKLKVHHLPSTP